MQFPTRVRLNLTDHAVSIVYRANGGEALTEEGDEITESYDLSRHLRPNTSIGTDLFIRDGYTQTSWNTQPDGSGLGIGLGSRVTVDGSLTLYSQWAAWTPADRFQYRIEDGGAVITACTETGSLLVVPEQLDGYPVTTLASGAFRACPADAVILPKSLLCIEKDAFFGAALSELCFFDNLERFSDTSFTD